MKFYFIHILAWCPIASWYENWIVLDESKADVLELFERLIKSDFDVAIRRCFVPRLVYFDGFEYHCEDLRPSMSFCLHVDDTQHTFYLAGNDSEILAESQIYSSFDEYLAVLYPDMDPKDLEFTDNDQFFLTPPRMVDYPTPPLPDLLEFDFEGHHYRGRVGQINDMDFFP